MADQKLTALTALLDSQVASTDVIYIVDVTGPTSYKITVQEFAQAVLANLASGSVTEAKLGYLSDVTSAIQAQLDAKQATITDSDDITEGAVNLFLTAAERAKLGFVSVTQAVDLDTMESDIATNTAKVSNATHTGDVTGSTTLTIDPTALTGKTAVTAVGADYVLISDTSDSGNLKKALISDFASAGGDMAAATYDPNTVAGDAFDMDNMVEGTDTKIMTAAERTKLSGIETGADVTDATNVDAAGAVMNSDTSTASMSFVVDEDTMSSDSATKVPTQQSVKAYVDTELSSQAEVIGIACSDETTDLTTGTAKATFRMPFAMTLTAVRANVNTAPVGSTIIVDINESGTTILSTKLSIDASEKTSTTAASAAVISDSALADDAEITIDIDQIGSSTAGKGLKVWLIGTRT